MSVAKQLIEYVVEGISSGGADDQATYFGGSAVFDIPRIHGSTDQRYRFKSKSAFDSFVRSMKAAKSPVAFDKKYPLDVIVSVG